MQVWIDDHEVAATAFTVQGRGVEAGRPRDLRQALKAATRGLLGRRRASAARAPGGGAAAVVGKEGGVLVRQDGDEVTLTAHAAGDPRPVVEAVEATLLRLQPREVRLAGALEGGVSPWRPYMAEGALFVRIVHRRESAFQTIEVGEHPVYGRMLFLNGETQIATSDEPLYSASLVDPVVGPETRRVCVLGGGDCGVLRQVLNHPVEEVVMAEIDAAVVEVAAEFFPGVVAGVREDPRARIVLGDALEALEETAPGSFDLVIYDLSDAPLEDATFDRLGRLVHRALAPQGRVAVQCGSALPRSAKQLRGNLAGLAQHFARVKTREVVIPSFLRQPWVFAAARRRADEPA